MQIPKKSVNPMQIPKKSVNPTQIPKKSVNPTQIPKNPPKYRPSPLCGTSGMCEGKPFKKRLVTSRPMILNDLSKPSEPCTHRQPSATFRAVHSSKPSEPCTHHNLPSRALIVTLRSHALVVAIIVNAQKYPTRNVCKKFKCKKPPKKFFLFFKISIFVEIFCLFKIFCRI